MKDVILAVSIVVAAIAAAVAHNSLKNRPIATMAVQDFFYEQSGLAIQVPEGSIVEIYPDFVLIVREDGLVTMVPNHRLHAIDMVGP